jgi:hypothetical protein
MKRSFVIHTHYRSLTTELESLLQSFQERGEYVTKGERNVIKKIAIGNEHFNIKKFKTPNLLQGFVYRFLRKSKAKRSFEYAQRLIDCGMHTPFPVGYQENYSVVLAESFYISKHLEYDLDFRVLNHSPNYPNREEILRQFTGFTFQLHENGIEFLDHSPGNTLIVDNGDGTYRFYLIDLNRMRFGNLDFDQRLRNFRRLWLSKTMIKIIAKEYAKLYGKSEEETRRRLSKHSRDFQRKKVAKKLRKKKWGL